jgi:hypothetical protein
MFEIGSDRGRIFVNDVGSIAGTWHRFYEPIDDLLALHSVPNQGAWSEENPSWPGSPPYRLGHLFWDYQPSSLWKSRAALENDARSWLRAGLPKLFERSAMHASKGQLLAELAPFLERVIFKPEADRSYDLVPDFPTLAAWTLFRSLDRRRFVVTRCELCGDPWLAASGAARYCHRLAPDSPTLTCLEVGSLRDHRARKRANKEGVSDG